MSQIMPNMEVIITAQGKYCGLSGIVGHINGDWAFVKVELEDDHGKVIGRYSGTFLVSNLRPCKWHEKHYGDPVAHPSTVQRFGVPSALLE